MPLRVTNTTIYKVPNPPSLDEYAEAYVPDAAEIATAPSIMTTSLMILFEQGKQEYLSTMTKPSSEEVTVDETGSNILVEHWDSESAYNNHVSLAKVEFDYASPDISDAVKVYYKIRAQYYKEYVANVAVTTETI